MQLSVVSFFSAFAHHSFSASVLEASFTLACCLLADAAMFGFEIPIDSNHSNDLEVLQS